MKYRLPIALAGFVLLCAVIGVLFYNQFGNIGGEQQFNLVIQDMKRLQADLQPNLPDSPWILQPSCSQAHEVYTAGTISCAVNLTYKQSVTNPKSLQRLTVEFGQILALHQSEFTKVTNKISVDTLPFLQTLQPGSASDMYKHVRTNMQCSSYIAITHDKPYVFTLMFTCSSTAQRFYYPRSDIG